MAAIALAAALSGCKGDQSKYTLDNVIKRGLGGSKPNPQQMVAMAFDPSDADKRRIGVQYLSNEKWGRQEPYTKGYATLVKTDSDPLVRSAAIRALGASGDMNYQAAVVQALGDVSPLVRWDAAVALDSLPGPAAVEPLRRQGVDDSSADVRSSCARSLRHYATPPVAQTLVRLLDDPSYLVRHAARKTLIEITGQDAGQDPAAWVGIIRGPLTRPAARNEYAWWDWMGAFPSKGESAAARPATQAEKPAGQRPWWDLMGVTRPAPAASQPATAPAGK